MASPSRSFLKRKADDLHSPQKTPRKTVWEVKMVDGVDTIRVYAPTCIEATTQCISNLVEKISDQCDSNDFLSSSLKLLESPEQDENMWRHLATKHRASPDHVQRLLSAVDTCTMRRIPRDHPDICWKFPRVESVEAPLQPVNLDWSCRNESVDDVGDIDPYWYAMYASDSDVEYIDPNWDAAKILKNELYGDLPDLPDALVV